MVFYVLEKFFFDLWIGMVYFSNVGMCLFLDGFQGWVGVSIIFYVVVLCEFLNFLYEKRIFFMELF